MLVITADAIDKDVGVYYYLHEHELLMEEHIHDGCHEIQLVLQGELTHRAGDHAVRQTAGDLVYLPLDSVHQLCDPTGDLMLLNLSFLPSTYEQGLSFLRAAAAPKRIVYNRVEPPVVDFLLWSHDRLIGKMQKQERTTIIRNTFTLLLPYCCDLAQPMDWFDSLLQQMQKQEHFQVGVTRMQELAFCSPSHLSRTCRARLGMTPTQYVDQLRIQYAENLLRHSQYNIRDICEECGYNNFGYFYRRFTEKTGLPPGKYQRLHSLRIQPLV